MAKQLQEIKTFHVGTLINADTGDIPIEAASYSLNIDSVTEDGKLKGIPDDVEFTVNIGSQSAAPCSEDNSDIDYILINGQPYTVTFVNGNWRVEDF